MTQLEGTYLTKEGLEKLKQELTELKTVKRKEIAERIQQAKELGDLSENAEYVEAKNEQGFMEGRILEVENILRNAILVENNHQSNGKIDIGSTITVTLKGKKREYAIVGYNEADPANGKISNESPIGKAFLGHKAGDTIEIETPSGVMKYIIESVQ